MNGVGAVDDKGRLEETGESVESAGEVNVSWTSVLSELSRALRSVVSNIPPRWGYLVWEMGSLGGGLCGMGAGVFRFERVRLGLESGEKGFPGAEDGRGMKDWDVTGPAPNWPLRLSFWKLGVMKRDLTLTRPFPGVFCDALGVCGEL